MNPTIDLIALTVNIGWEYNGQFRYTTVILQMNTDEKLFYKCDDPDIIIPAFKEQLNKVMDNFCAIRPQFSWVHLD